MGHRSEKAGAAGLIAVFVIIAAPCGSASCGLLPPLIVVLGVLTALGTIYEEKTGYNVFYEASTALSSPVATVDPGADGSRDPDPTLIGRPVITGPTKHALSVASILGMAMSLRGDPGGPHQGNCAGACSGSWRRARCSPRR